ncbi:MAG: hypothetical protein LRY51_15400 [Geovibrio sp.]|nr:hypothetical protein [Geovibrio sp.]
MKLIKADYKTADFRWKDREQESPFPPVTAEINGVMYRLSGFGRELMRFFMRDC